MQRMWGRSRIFREPMHLYVRRGLEVNYYHAKNITDYEERRSKYLEMQEDFVLKIMTRYQSYYKGTPTRTMLVKMIRDIRKHFYTEASGLSIKDFRTKLHDEVLIEKECGVSLSRVSIDVCLIFPDNVSKLCQFHIDYQSPGK
jgi:hypothetical protein